MINEELYKISIKAIDILRQYKLKISTAESCTGGMVSSYITSVPGVSEFFELGITSYSCRIKNEILNVNNKTLEQFGAISEQTAREMAENVRKISKSDIGLAVTGVAGPDSSEGHPAGYVYISVSGKNGTKVELLNIKPKNRNYIREQATKALFNLLIKYVEVNF